MRKRLLLTLVFFSGVVPAFSNVAVKPAALISDGVPAVSEDIVKATRPYMEFRSAAFLGFNNQDRSVLISTRFGNVAQLHRVSKPMGTRTQISFEEEPVVGTWSPTGDVLVVSKDHGGDEFFQLYTLKDGQLTLLTDGKSRNSIGVWSKDGNWLAYSSTRRNGVDNDVYVIDPKDGPVGRTGQRRWMACDCL